MNARPDSSFADPMPEHAGPAFVVDLDGFEGPLDLLLTLAREQKVDLAHISISALAEQYLAFVTAVRLLRLELAADYLVMAAWLAYLKSRLLLPEPEPAEGEPTAEELAERLALRLRRLEAMRTAAVRLLAQPCLGRDVFARGAPEPLSVTEVRRYQASLYELLAAYGEQQRRRMARRVVVRARPILSLQDALAALTRLVGEAADWTPLLAFLAEFAAIADRPSIIASAFTASLELARVGRAEIRQSGAFGPLYLRRRAADRADAPRVLHARAG